MSDRDISSYILLGTSHMEESLAASYDFKASLSPDRTASVNVSHPGPAALNERPGVMLRSAWTRLRRVAKHASMVHSTGMRNRSFGQPVGP